MSVESSGAVLVDSVPPQGSSRAVAWSTVVSYVGSLDETMIPILFHLAEILADSRRFLFGERRLDDGRIHDVDILFHELLVEQV